MAKTEEGDRVSSTHDEISTVQSKQSVSTSLGYHGDPGQQTDFRSAMGMSEGRNLNNHMTCLKPK